ncbi:VWA domain-containing protein [Luteococcus peritonei]|uniref:VWA domain-containing protein n=1 Tax=Luteococcus peritonei TaxID=88874 RepID=A0ABW4RXA5_9ACTN
MDLAQTLTGFTHALRAAGMDVSTHQLLTMTQAVAWVDPAARSQVKAACRASCCTSPEQVEVHDRLFDQFFGSPGTLAPAPPPAERPLPSSGGTGTDPGSLPQAVAHDDHREAPTAAYLAPGERAFMDDLIRHIRTNPPLRAGRRYDRPRGTIDPAATTRALLSNAGLVRHLERHRTRPRPRRVVIVVDVSGSMRADAALHLAFAVATHHATTAEVFTVSTRLHRYTDVLRSHPDPGDALTQLRATITDYGSGTRLSDGLVELVDWGRRGPLRGSLLLVCSDGLERGDPSALGEATRRASLLAHRLLWLHPRAAVPGWTPQTRGLRSALPWMDALVGSGSQEQLLSVADMLPHRWSAPSFRGDPDARAA